ncbi:MAG: ParB N-terminal domain-containing protein, partial [Deltaproteobacteria bacterium]|nr:ParB N-terminal domain-containing protein [Deltaproteobacteria bacterium]
IDHLMASIDHVGVLNPPLLIEKKSGYKIVCGFRRIEACWRLGWSDVEARILDSDTKRLECIKYAITDNSLQRPLNLIEQSRSITDNSLQRPLNLIEQSRSIHLLYGFFKDVSALGKSLSVMGLPDNPSIIKKIKELYHLSKFVQSGILSNTISLAMALELGRLQPEAGECLAKLFQTLSISLNKQREILRLVKEISLREDISMLKVVENDNLQKILTNKNLDRNQKIREIRVYLKQRRFPVITTAEKEFEKHVKKLKLGSGTKLIPPDNFEGTTYTLKLFFKNLIEFKERKASVDALITNPFLNKILDRLI